MFGKKATLNTVKCPKDFEPIFLKAQEYVSKFFSEEKVDPSKGTIEIFGERYILMRAASMSVEFFNTVDNLFGEKASKREAENFARNLLFDLAHSVGMSDARDFHKKMNLKDPIEKLSAGPVHFSHAGWAFVDIFPESKPTPDENYYLIYDHPYSFESDSWQREGKIADFPVCVMNAGYSSGWCEESFGIPLVATEVMCKAKGDEACRFIMGHPSKMKEHLTEYAKTNPEVERAAIQYEIPNFFERKIAEDRLKEEEVKFQILINNIPNALYTTLPDENGTCTFMSGKWEEWSGYSPKDFYSDNETWLKSVHPEDKEETLAKFVEAFKKNAPYSYEYRLKHKDTGKVTHILDVGIPRKDNGGKVLNYDGIATDITERKKREDELKEKTEDLEALNEKFVGRELKMIELKKRIEELEGKKRGADEEK